MNRLLSISVLTLAFPLAVGSSPVHAEVITGVADGWYDTDLWIGDGVNEVYVSWSICTYDKGWFYGYDKLGTEVAFATGVTSIDQIADASIYEFIAGHIGPYCDADCAPDGIGEFIVWRNSDGYYAVLRVEDIFLEDVDDPQFATLSGTWWFQTDGTPYFSDTGECPHDGDVDEDGQVTQNDARLAMQFSRGQIELNDCQQNRADVVEPVDPGSNITTADAVCISRKARGRMSCFL